MTERADRKRLPKATIPDNILAMLSMSVVVDPAYPDRRPILMPKTAPLIVILPDAHEGSALRS